jgi:hypothetical protein
MNFKQYSKLNNIIGWLVFAIAAFTYLMTIEHTVSLWDCGEFTSCDYKLEIPHPPGAPFYTLLYRLFAIAANPTYSAASVKMVPIFVNAASAIASAFTILFLFWTITALLTKAAVKDEQNIDRGYIYAILGAGAIGALAYTFSDTFWFSAVEAEVYSMSSFFTAIIFWLALKWERRANEPRNLKWMVLIFYCIGLTIGVHLLGLLVIPAIVLIIYFKKYKNTTLKGALLAMLVGFVALAIVQYGIILYMPLIASQVDLWFVNSLHMPFWVGVIFFYAIILGAAAYGIYWSHKNGRVILNTSLACFIAVVLGFSSYGASVIRSYANPPIDMNNPEDVFSLESYLSREQYGDSYLLYGPYYTAYTEHAASTKNGAAIWTKYTTTTNGKEETKYVKTGYKYNYEFPSQYMTLFPRMFNGTMDNYISGYRYWGDVQNDKPTFKNDLLFFFRYQIGYMYWRYFAWNFIGRQNDIQGLFGEFTHGNWMTGIGFIDDKILGLGPQNNLPDYLADNKARNPLYALPFILGLLGLFYQYKRDKNNFFIVAVFFFMTGLAIELYLNMPSTQPRERDYAFVGSFYVYAIWIGMGVMWIYDKLRTKVNGPTAAFVATGITLVLVPCIMAAKEWNDHDRSKRTASRDYGVDYLQSCAPHAVLFTNGDNDTYPLWYAQEVEGIRDDVRIINLSLFGTDWYVNQMRRPINHAPALSFTLTPASTLGWEALPYEESLVENLNIDTKQYQNIFDVLNFVASSDPATKAQTQEGETVPFLPSKKLRIPVNRRAAIASGTVRPQDTGFIVDHIDVDLTGNFIPKNTIMLFDFIATNQWKLPIYFSTSSVSKEDFMNLGPYMQQEGLCERLVPVMYPGMPQNDETRRVASDVMYNNMMNKFEWGMLDKKPVFVDYVLSNQSKYMRLTFHTLARQLLNENQNQKAIAVCDKAFAVVPNDNVTFNYYNTLLADVYYKAGDANKGKKWMTIMVDMANKELSYYAKVKQDKWEMVNMDIKQAVNTLRIAQEDAQESKQQDFLAKITPLVNTYTTMFAGQLQ